MVKEEAWEKPFDVVARSTATARFLHFPFRLPATL
jgi:hypothetical protein